MAAALLGMLWYRRLPHVEGNLKARKRPAGPVTAVEVLDQAGPGPGRAGRGRRLGSRPDDGQPVTRAGYSPGVSASVLVEMTAEGDVAEPTAGLTPEQRRIVEYGDGPVVVIAGAGTGKTRVIVERIRWLLDTKGSGSRDALGRLVPAEPAEPASAAEPIKPVPAPARDAGRPGRAVAGRPRAGDCPATASAAAPPGPFDGPLLPEQILVLTYNVKAARELQDRLDKAVGPGGPGPDERVRTSTASVTRS